MRSEQQFDLDFRPETYWPWLPTEAQMLARIKGSVRRATAATVLKTGGPAALDPSLFEESLSEEERIAVGGLHPALMGGEYLPNSRREEVEIARIELASTLCDVISIRARRRGRRIAYTVVDEYETVFSFRPATSTQPLTLRQLIRSIEKIEVIDQPEAAWPETADIIAGLRNNALDWDLDDPASFVTVSSEIYHELGPHYDQETQEWLAELGADLPEQQTPTSDGLDSTYEAENQAMLEAYQATSCDVCRNSKGQVVQASVTYSDGTSDIVYHGSLRDVVGPVSVTSSTRSSEAPTAGL